MTRSKILWNIGLVSSVNVFYYFSNEVDAHSVILLKQYLRKVVKIISPYRPCVSAGIFAVGIFNAHVIKLCKHDLAIIISNVLLTTHCYPERFQITVDTRSIVFHECILRICEGWLIRKPTRTEYAEIRKHIGVFYSCIQCLQTAQ